MSENIKKKACQMATSAVKHKSPVDELLDDFDSVIEQGASKMTAEEIDQASSDFKKIVRGPSSKPARRETA